MFYLGESCSPCCLYCLFCPCCPCSDNTLNPSKMQGHNAMPSTLRAVINQGNALPYISLGQRDLFRLRLNKPLPGRGDGN